MPLLSVFSIPVCAVLYSDTGRLISDTETGTFHPFPEFPCQGRFHPVGRKKKIQGTYFKICPTYFKISQTYFPASENYIGTCPKNADKNVKQKGAFAGAGFIC